MRAVIVFAIGMALSACSSYQVLEIDAGSEAFPTQSRVRPNQISANKPYDLSRAGFIVLRTANPSHPAEYSEFVTKSLAQLGLSNVITPEEFARRIIAADIDGATASFDLVNLNRVYRALGPFLVATFTLDWTGTYVNHRVSIIDPESNERLFDVQRAGGVMLSLDAEYNYPVLNVLREWVIASGGLGHAPESDIVSGPVARTVYGWHADELDRSTHLASGLRVPGRIAGMRPTQHLNYDDDLLNGSLMFFRDDPPLWMSFFVYPRYHGMPEPLDEIRVSLSNTVSGTDGTIESLTDGTIPVSGTRRHGFLGNTRIAGEDGEVFTWTVLVPTRGWYLKVLASEYVRPGVEPGKDALDAASRLFSSLGLTGDGFGESRQGEEPVRGFVPNIHEICRNVRCHPPRTLTWIKNDGTEGELHHAEPQRVVVGGEVTLHAGDRVALRPTIVDGAITELTAVDPDGPLADTIVVELVPFTDEDGAVLKITNPFDEPLRYRAFMRPPDVQDRYPLITCRIEGKTEGKRDWPHWVYRVSVSDFEFAAPDDSDPCATSPRLPGDPEPIYTGPSSQWG